MEEPDENASLVGNEESGDEQEAPLTRLETFGTVATVIILISVCLQILFGVLGKFLFLSQNIFGCFFLFYIFFFL